MTETPYFLEYRSSKSPNVLPTSGGEQGFGKIRNHSLAAKVCKPRVKSKTETMMRKKWMLTTFILIGMAALTGAAAYGQDDASASGKSGAAAKARSARDSQSQWDIGVSFYEALTSSSSGSGTQEKPSNGMGGLAEVRHIVNPLVGFELSVGFNLADEAYAPKAGACALTCQNPPVSLSGNATQVALDYIVSKKMGNLRPFAVGGLGAFIAVPGTTPLGNNTSFRGAYIVGGGVDFDISSRLGVRAQVRDILYKAPNTSVIYPATGVLTQSLEPMGGVYYRF
ncbi:MAG: outer membrane beta-barrel protein [Terracidiphilus sp.]